MKWGHLLLIVIVNLNYLSADEPAAVISKTRGKVKYKLETESKYRSNVRRNMPVYLNSRIQTRKKAFSKIIYLDDGSVISIYPRSEIIIEGSITERVVKKQIKVVRGIVHVHLESEIETGFNLFTASAELKCNKCSFWVLSNGSINDKFICESGQVELYNPSVNSTIKLMPDSTVISKDKMAFAMIATPVTDIKLLESLMLDADEQSIEYKNKESEEQKEDLITNIVVIKLKNAANEEREIVLTYTQKNNILIE